MINNNNNGLNGIVFLQFQSNIKSLAYTLLKINFREALIIIMITQSIVLELVNLSRANKERESPMMLSYQAMLRTPAAGPN